MARLSIYEFENYREYLKVVGTQFPSRRNRKITLARWAKQLGYKSPRSIAMVLKGQRFPSTEMLWRISRHFNHTDAEHRYLELMIQLERRRSSGTEFASILEELKKIRPKGFNQATIDANSFSYIAEWYHFPIKQLISTSSFKNNPRWICKALRSCVTEAEVKHAIKNLINLGIVKVDPSGRLRVVKSNLHTQEDVPDEALRKHHRGMIKQALDSIDAPDFHNREITSVTLKISQNDIREAKEEIRKFRDRFHSMFEATASNHIYQLNFQLFELTNPNEGENNETSH